jgi:hypothetical protein
MMKLLQELCADRDAMIEAHTINSISGIEKYVKECQELDLTDNANIASGILGLLKIPKLRKVTFPTSPNGFAKSKHTGYPAKIINKYLPEGDLFDCQEELIEAGFAKL